VFIAQHPTEAHLVVGLLASQGIAAEVRGEPLFSVRGEVPVTPSTLPTVWVLEDSQAEPALALIRDRAASAEQPWTCASCGETVEPQFSVCWKCGQPLGAAPQP